MHEYGLSTPQDFKAAIECYEQAAMQVPIYVNICTFLYPLASTYMKPGSWPFSSRQKSNMIMCMCGSCYEKGHLDGTYNLALMRAYGRGCAQDWQRASLLFQRVRRFSYLYTVNIHNHIYNIATSLYEYLTRLTVLCMVWQAADRGHGPSAYYVGVLSLYGHGMPRNYDLALHWFERAAAAVRYISHGLRLPLTLTLPVSVCWTMYLILAMLTPNLSMSLCGLCVRMTTASRCVRPRRVPSYPSASNEHERQTSR